MPLVNWNESYTVKVQRCDEDHKKLFSLINTLHEAMSSGKGTAVVRRVVEELADYAQYHFSAEEAMLEKTNYPALASHRLQHREFSSQVKQFQRDLREGKGGQTITVAVFLNDWLTKHIKQTDQQYSAHLNANGIF
jgi:hemerythrin-like metal-binding protein